MGLYLYFKAYVMTYYFKSILLGSAVYLGLPRPYISETSKIDGCDCTRNTRPNDSTAMGAYLGSGFDLLSAYSIYSCKAPMYLLN